MRKTLSALAMLAVTGGSVAVAPISLVTTAMAQTKNGATNGSGAGSAAGLSNKPVAIEAPIGHRQPRAADLPSNADDPMRLNSDDAALDRQIKSICRGC